jgi:hypothetical protein
MLSTNVVYELLNACSVDVFGEKKKITEKNPRL